MINFFKHVKFWGPFVVVTLIFLLMELVLRTGVWDKKIKPRSYLGHGVYRANAITEYGLDKINWVAVGNSVLDWGINHKRFRTAMKQQGIEYARMTMGSSKFPVVQMVADWSVKNMNQLDGLIIGASPSGLGGYNLATQFKVSWAFIDAYDADQYQYSATGSSLDDFHQKLALFVYFDDIKDYFINFNSRNQKKDSNYSNSERILNFNVKNPKDVCGYQLASLTECVDTANLLRENSKKTSFEREIIRRCPVKLKRKQRRLGTLSRDIDQNTIDIYVQNWTKLMLSLADRSKKIKFIVLPEHSIIKYTTKANGLDEVMDRLIDNISKSELIEVHDLRSMFNHNQQYDECQLFNDGIHLNDTGKNILTEYLLDSFD